MKFVIGAGEKLIDHVGPFPVRMRRLEGESGILLIAFGGEAHIIELDFVNAGGRHRRASAKL